MQIGPDLAVISEIAVLHAVKQMVAANAKNIHFLDCYFSSAFDPAGTDLFALLASSEISNSFIF